MTVDSNPWEVVKPLPKQHGTGRPFISINSENSISFSKTAKTLLGFDPDGHFEIVLNRTNRKLYLVPRGRKSSSTFFLPKSGKLNDLALPDKLRVMYKLPEDKIGRLYLSTHPESYDSEKAYKLDV